MLNEHDRSLIDREKSITGLPFLLSPGALSSLLRDQSGADDPGELELGYLRYKPGMNCIARFEFDAGGKRHFAYAKAFGGDAEVKLAKARDKASGTSPIGPGSVVLDKERILFSVFPHDAKLRSVGQLSEEESRRNLLQRLFKSRTGWDTATFEPLNYKPERRYVARFTNLAGESATVKFYSSGEFRKVREFRKHLQPTLNVRFPDWIGGSKAHRALAFSWLPGQVLRGLPWDERLEAARRAGAALAHFHRGTQPRFRPRAAEHLTIRTLSLAKDLAMLLPDQGPCAGNLARTLVEWREQLDGPQVPVHGDFYDKQVVAGDDGVALIDSDNAHIGYRESDIGCFIAHLERNAINHLLPHGDIASQTTALLEGYREVDTTGFSRLEPHTAYALFQLIHNPFRDRARDWPEQTRALLVRVRALLEAGK